jgi:hypothetical protein
MTGKITSKISPGLIASPEIFISELTATYAELDQITVTPAKVAPLDRNARNDLNKVKVKSDPRARHAYTEFVLNMVTAKSYGNAEKSVKPELGGLCRLLFVSFPNECCFILLHLSVNHYVGFNTNYSLSGVPRATVQDLNETAREHGLDNSYLGERW